MAVFKCKMCGGTINFEEGASVGVCDSCGTKQTLPRLNDDRVRRLHDRANHFRRNKDFDKAAAIYEEILNEDNTDAEVYWSLVLCKYGIDYVESPDTHKQVPTVNRAQFTSIFDDANYKSALEHADSAQREIYEKEAEAINNIQKGILAISQKEEPFDIFICYKETDENGNRTPDSVLAYDLYHLLSKEGLKVFFSRVTLEDKLGTAYEPYIFAALSTAKVMVVMGTKPEYFNAVWVKNEWSRYLKLVEQSKGQKVIIPAYRDMDPYDLPDELSHLQALDMGKLGFMQDLTRGIKKIVRDDEQTPTTVISRGGSANTDALLKRAFMFLEEGNWSEADAYCERVLDEDPENANAYLGKLMAELMVNYKENLSDYNYDFSYSSNYEKVMRFGDDILKAQLNEYIKTIQIRKKKEEIENAYQQALTTMNRAYNKSDYLQALDIFKSLGDYKDSQYLISQCLTKLEEIKVREEEELRERRIIEEKRRIERERREENARIAREKAKNKLRRCRKIALTTTSVIIFALVLFKIVTPNVKYKKALTAIDNNDYIKAYGLLDGLNGYKDSNQVLENIRDRYLNQEKEVRDKTKRYEQALSWIKEEKYSKAYGELTSLGDFKDSASLAEEVYPKYIKEKLINIGLYEYTITFGYYEQDGNLENGKEPIEWIVIGKDGPTVTLLSLYALDNRQLNSDLDFKWVESDLIKWLNGSFYSEAFSPDEQEMINKRTIDGVEIKVSLLTNSQASELVNERYCEPTPYAISKGVDAEVLGNFGRIIRTCSYWLTKLEVEEWEDWEDIGGYPEVVTPDGDIIDTKATSEAGVRPVIYISLE